MEATESIPSSSHDDDGVWETQRQEIIQTLNKLPRVEGWNDSGFCHYQGFWFSPVSLPGVMSFQQHFQAHDDDIILVSYPKSGTTWLKALVYSIVNRERSELVGHELRQQKDQTEDTPLLKSNPHALVPIFEYQVYEGGVPHEEYLLTGGNERRLFSTHIPYSSLAESVKSSGCKIIYICRNPLDVVVSFWHFARKLPMWEGSWTIEKFVDRFCSGEFLFGPFADHLLGYWKESLDRREKVLFLKYEEMKADSAAQVKKLAEFLGFPFSEDEESRGVVDGILSMCSLGNLQGLEASTRKLHYTVH